jgi:hypothetical protein
MGKLPPRTLIAKIKELKEQNQALRVALSILGGKIKAGTQDRWGAIELPLPDGYIIIRRREPEDR